MHIDEHFIIESMDGIHFYIQFELETINQMTALVICELHTGAL